MNLIRPGNPVEGGKFESFKGQLRDECRNVSRFASIKHARLTPAIWREDCNLRRPHGSPGNLTTMSTQFEVGNGLLRQTHSSC
jgi:transposase InsO family protein